MKKVFAWSLFGFALLGFTYLYFEMFAPVNKTFSQYSTVSEMKEALSRPNNITENWYHLIYLDLAKIHSDPNSRYYDEQKAGFYFKNSLAEQFGMMPDKDICTSYFEDAYRSIVLSRIAQSVRNFYSRLCNMNDRDLLAVAQDFETEGGSHPKNFHIAYYIYKHLVDRQYSHKGFNPEIIKFRKEIEERMKNIKPFL